MRLDDALLERARKEAERRGMTLTALIEQGLELVLRKSMPRHERERVRLPVSRATGGTRPGIDLDNSAALLDALDGRH